MTILHIDKRIIYNMTLCYESTRSHLYNYPWSRNYCVLLSDARVCQNHTLKNKFEKLKPCQAANVPAYQGSERAPSQIY